MKINCLFIFTLLTFTLTNCQSAKPAPKVTYSQKIVNNWIGFSLDKRIRQTRKPDKIYYKGNRKYAVWRIVGYYLRGGAPHLETLCTYTFEVSRRGIIVAGNAKGIKCLIHGPRKGFW